MTMLQLKERIKSLKARISAIRKNIVNYSRDWRNEHGQPNLEYLQSLVKEGSPRSIEKLKSIANDLDVDFSPGVSPEELIDRILSDTRSETTITT